MTKFDLKKIIAENKATFFSSLDEGKAAYAYEVGKEKGEEIEKEKLKEVSGNKKAIIKTLSGYYEIDPKEFEGFKLDGTDEDTKKVINFVASQETPFTFDQIQDNIEKLINSTGPSSDEVYPYGYGRGGYGRSYENKETTMTKEALKTKIKEMILAELNEENIAEEKKVEYYNNYSEWLKAIENEFAPLEDLNMKPGETESFKSYFTKAGKGEESRYAGSWNEDTKTGLVKPNEPSKTSRYIDKKNLPYYGESKEALKEKIKEMILAELNEENIDVTNLNYDFLPEAKKEDEEATDAPEATDIEVSAEETPTSDSFEVSTSEVDPTIKAIQDALTQAQAAAQKLGDEKLTDQIGNTITFFTRTHVANKDVAPVAEELDEAFINKMKHRAGIIK